MGKPHREKMAQQEAPPPVEVDAGPVLTEPLYGVTRGEKGAWVAVRYLNGKVEPLTPIRNGKHVGERLHYAIPRAIEAFKMSVLGSRRS